MNGKANLSKEQLLEAVMKKRVCNAKAQATVESLLEQNNKAEYFLKQLNYINPGHYDDIVEERNILHYCGYALCGKELNEVPNKKYQISTQSNKVYDITERKKFCSTQCFKASEYIKLQIPKTPLWLRNHELAAEFKLIQIEK